MGISAGPAALPSVEGEPTPSAFRDEPPVSDPLPTHAGPFALGTFGAGAGAPFPGLVTERQVRDLSDVAPGVRALLEDWDASLVRLTALARNPGGTWYDLADLRVLAPIESGQILQSGANYRRHVVDLVVAERESVHGATPEEARADAERMMDERARNGVPTTPSGCAPSTNGTSASGSPTRWSASTWVISCTSCAATGCTTASPSPADPTSPCTTPRSRCAAWRSTCAARAARFASRVALNRLVKEEARALLAMLAMPGLCAADIDLSAGMIAPE
jgi:hypothetical protein